MTPAELLGLTATPERADGLSVLDYFDGRIAAEMRLWDAIAEQRLVPFQYFGIHDGASTVDVPWRRGQGYDIEALANVYTADDAWVRLVIRQTRAQVATSTAMRALGFCVSVESRAVHGPPLHAGRDSGGGGVGATRLSGARAGAAGPARGSDPCVFSVDLFNEGVDIPQVDTLLLLRPTESATLFLQQLGRGLRRAQDKGVCTVLDFISQHRQEFRFDLKLRALIGGGTRRDLSETSTRASPTCRRAPQPPWIPSPERSSSGRSETPCRPTCRGWRPKSRPSSRQGHEPTLPTFLRESGLALSDVYAGSRAFCDVLERAGVPLLPAGPHERQLRRAVGRLLHIDDLERIATYRRCSLGIVACWRSSERDIRLWRMLVGAGHAGGAARSDSLADATAHLWAHPQVRAEIAQLLEVLGERVDHEHPALDADSACPLLIHARYSRVEIQAALGEGTGALVPLWQEGVKWLPDKRVDALVVTIDKSDGGFSPSTAYRDFALSRTLFHWESQSRTSADSPAGHALPGARERGHASCCSPE